MRGRARAVSLAWVAALVCFGPAVAHADGLRIEDAVHMALRKNERSQKAPLRVDTAEGQLARARGAFFPTLTANDAETWNPNAQGNAPSLTNNGTLTLSQPIVNPSAFPLYAQQKHNVESERWGGIEDRRRLAFDTAKAFILALTAERVLASAIKRSETAKANLEASQARAQAGLASTNDVTRAELDLASSQQQIATAQGNVQKAYVALSFLVGEKVEPPLVAPEQTTKAAQAYEQSARNDVRTALQRRENAISSAQERRPDVRSLHEKVESAQWSAREPLYRLAPSLNASAQMRVFPAPLPTQRAVDETLGLTLTWQIFDAGFRYADRRTRLAQARSSELDEKLLRRSVQKDIDTALAGLRAARTTYEVAATAVEAAQRNVDETTILYKQGLAKQIEVTDAVQKRFDAEVTQQSAKLTMEQAYLDLRDALGFGPIDNEEVGLR